MTNPECTVRRAGPRTRLGRWILALATAATLPAAAAWAGPPPAAPPSPAPSPSSSPTAGGYWLSVELVGEPDGQTAAMAALTVDVDDGRVPTDAAPPGAWVGSAPDVATALRWVVRHAFAAPVPGAADHGPPDRIATGPAPVPGGPLLEAHEVIVAAFIVSGATPDGGLRTIAWPSDQSLIVPPDLGLHPAALTASRAPLFAAPAPRVPPAVQRHAMVRRAGGLLVLGWLDRCDAERTRCLRWAQVIARDGDRFLPGYLPAYLVARQDGWVQGASALPRAQLLRSGTADDQAEFLLLARDRHGDLHRKRLQFPLVDGGFPAATVSVAGEWATIEAPGVAPQRIALDRTMDLRVRKPSGPTP